ncbi:hypothetical protein [Candidatus Thiothrix anitrata]|uniref:Uncharacterized protein n=1 Tax=Candidatus Thiothrix anitrata TaxID=2823902 RepID=A0ABX7X4V2_9GAMM|nr:hypothetical protein [Candidatus Thiothrix anitrata]QTR50871.1 hypothetical protein J8380_04695 [Candidatus Thiothrix anitrata]
MLEKLLRGGETQTPPELPFTFTLANEKRLKIDLSSAPERAWGFLSHHIRRYPQDLRAHTQRILLAQGESLQERLAGSLQDIFIALGNSGQQLRAHLLELTKDQLSSEDGVFFNEWLEQGSTFSGATMKWRMGSLLASGQEAATANLLRIERGQETAQYTDVMAEVVACLEYGQIDTARELLETEIQSGNTDEAMEQELVSIYQYTRDKGRLDAMITHLQAAGRELSPMWLEKQQESESW